MPAPEFSPFGLDLFGEPIRMQAQAPLADRFLFPPFSVLDARSGEWQARKDAWLALGIQSEIGRGGNLLGMSETVLAGGFGGNGERRRLQDSDMPKQAGGGWADGGPARRDAAFYAKKREWEATNGREISTEEFRTEVWEPDEGYRGTSIFDPVLCELAYRWWCPPGGQIVDPFAGGSVRGVVASMMGHSYWGCDLRQEQIDANRAQGEQICGDDLGAQWYCGDARDLLARAPAADMIFSCPPYGSLECYSEDPRDLSTMRHPEFLEAYRLIIRLACERLRQDRFAVFVVGDFRDKRTGLYHDFISSTIAAFRAAGLGFYSDGVLVTAVGSLPMRLSGQFEKSRKLGKTHQNLLTFVKGDPTKWTKPQ